MTLENTNDIKILEKLMFNIRNRNVTENMAEFFKKKEIEDKSSEK